MSSQRHWQSLLLWQLLHLRNLQKEWHSEWANQTWVLLFYASLWCRSFLFCTIKLVFLKTCCFALSLWFSSSSFVTMQFLFVCVFFVQVFFSLWCISVVWFTTWVVFKRDVHNWFRLPCRLSQAQFVHVWAQDQLEILSINVTMVVHFVRKVKVLLSSLDQIFSKTPFALLLDSPFQHHPLALFWTSPPLTVWEVYGYSCCMHSSRPVSYFCTIQPAPQKLKGELRGFTSWEIRKLQGISTSGGIRELQEASQSWGIRNFHKWLRERERGEEAGVLPQFWWDFQILKFAALGFCSVQEKLIHPYQRGYTETIKVATTKSGKRHFLFQGQRYLIEEDSLHRAHFQVGNTFAEFHQVRQTQTKLSGGFLSQTRRRNTQTKLDLSFVFFTASEWASKWATSGPYHHRYLLYPLIWQVWIFVSLDMITMTHVMMMLLNFRSLKDSRQRLLNRDWRHLVQMRFHFGPSLSGNRSSKRCSLCSKCTRSSSTPSGSGLPTCLWELFSSPLCSLLLLLPSSTVAGPNLPLLR